MKKMSITVQPKQHHKAKMTKEELQEYLKMVHLGASTTKNGKAYKRREKHVKARF